MGGGAVWSHSPENGYSNMLRALALLCFLCLFPDMYVEPSAFFHEHSLSTSKTGSPMAIKGVTPYRHVFFSAYGKRRGWVGIYDGFGRLLEYDNSRLWL